MSQNAGDGSGNPSSGSASDNASGSAVNSIDIERSINDAVSRALGSRMKRLNIEEQIQKAVEAALSKVTEPQAQVSTQQAGNPAVESSEKLSMKALQDQIAGLHKALQTQQQAAKDADLRARDAQMRSTVQAKLASKIGADNPSLPLLMDSLYSTQKRFVEQDGRTAVRFNSEYGEEFKSLDEGINALFESELKHLIAPQSKAGSLPPSSIRGMPVQNAAPQTGMNAIYREVASHFANHGNPEFAAALNNTGNGDPSK